MSLHWPVKPEWSSSGYEVFLPGRFVIHRGPDAPESITWISFSQFVTSGTSPTTSTQAKIPNPSSFTLSCPLRILVFTCACFHLHVSYYSIRFSSNSLARSRGSTHGGGGGHSDYHPIWGQLITCLPCIWTELINDSSDCRAVQKKKKRRGYRKVTDG